jgi:hypothetical protein
MGDIQMLIMAAAERDAEIAALRAKVFEHETTIRDLLHGTERLKDQLDARDRNPAEQRAALLTLDVETIRRQRDAANALVGELAESVSDLAHLIGVIHDKMPSRLSILATPVLQRANELLARAKAVRT